MEFQIACFRERVRNAADLQRNNSSFTPDMLDNLANSLIKAHFQVLRWIDDEVEPWHKDVADAMRFDLLSHSPLAFDLPGILLRFDIIDYPTEAADAFKWHKVYEFSCQWIQHASVHTLCEKFFAAGVGHPFDIYRGVYPKQANLAGIVRLDYHENCAYSTWKRVVHDFHWLKEDAFEDDGFWDQVGDTPALKAEALARYTPLIPDLCHIVEAYLFEGAPQRTDFRDPEAPVAKRVRRK